MATLTFAKPRVSADCVQRFEEKLHDLRRTVASLPGEDYYAHMLETINRPGWTTVADGLFFEAVVDTMLARARELEQLHQRLQRVSATV